ncbi:PDZK1-interacting protein 1 isoform X2 [Struthio camelus]|uniref:PDZK1-interacting protein 1 isoform X2 n=1 Tax=Struthio camelus TaxID=8801 RepID=UPI003603C7A5
MPALRLVALWLLLALEPGSCQAARGNLQPWSQGVIAVVVFLVLVAIAFVVNKFWCKEKEENVEAVVSIGDKPEAVLSNGREGRYLTAAADFRSKECQHAYENTLEPEEKVITTAM